MNGDGQIVFSSALAGTGVTTANDSAIFSGTASGGVSVLFREGDTIPGPTGLTFGNIDFSPATIADGGAIAFVSGLAGPGGTPVSNNLALFAGLPGNVRMAVRVGDAVPSATPGTFFGDLSGATPNANAQVLFQGSLFGPTVTTSNDRGLYVADTAGEVVAVVREGNFLDRGTVIAFSPGTMNDRGQVPYRVTFADNTTGVYLFTPDLHWRPTGSGNWDVNTN